MSMFINFYVRKRGQPGDTQLTAGRFDYVPRVGETVSMDDVPHEVQSVEYDLSKNSITIILM